MVLESTTYDLEELVLSIETLQMRLDEHSKTHSKSAMSAMPIVPNQSQRGSAGRGG